MKNALTESRDCWKPAEMQFIKWATEGMVKGKRFSEYSMT